MKEDFSPLRYGKSLIYRKAFVFCKRKLTHKENLIIKYKELNKILNPIVKTVKKKLKSQMIDS